MPDQVAAPILNALPGHGFPRAGRYYGTSDTPADAQAVTRIKVRDNTITLVNDGATVATFDVLTRFWFAPA